MKVERRITRTLFGLTGVVMLLVGIFGNVPARYGVLWELTAVGFFFGAGACGVSMFTTRWFYLRIGAIAFPWMVRGALYFATPDALPKRNEIAAGAINMLVGVSVILIEARGDPLIEDDEFKDW